MANKYRNEVEITLGGKKYTLRASWETIVGIETTLNTSILALIARGSLTFKEAATVILLGLHGADDKSLTFDEIGKAVFEDGMSRIGRPVIEFLSIAMDGAKLGKQEPETAKS